MYKNNSTQRKEQCFFPKRTDDGCTVYLIRLYDTYYGNIEQAPLMKLLYMTIDAALHEHPPTGLIVVIDLKGAGIMHLSKVRLNVFRAFLEYLQEGLPVKLKGIHILNTAPFIHKLMFLIKPFLKKEVYDMINFHTSDMDMDVFYENWIPKKCLSEDYGGNLPPFRSLHHQNTEKLTNLESYFREEELQRRSVNQ